MFIETLELANFKSFFGEREISHFDFTNAIIGPNGTGKSNIVDAICFVFGDTSKNLRCRRLGDVVYQNPNLPEKDSGRLECFVRIRIRTNTDESFVFERKMKRDGTEKFFVNNSVVSKAAYLQKLQKLGIFVNTGSFVVRQGSVPSLASGKSDAIRKFIDVVSGASEHEEECAEQEKVYDNCQKHVAKYRDVLMKAQGELSHLGHIAGVQKEMNAKTEELKSADVDYTLMRLYPLRKEIAEIDRDYDEEVQQILSLELQDKSQVEARLRQFKREMTAIRGEISNLQHVVDELVTKRTACTNTVTEAKNQLRLTQGKVSKQQNMLTALERRDADRLIRIREIEEQLRTLKSEVEAINTKIDYDASRCYSQEQLEEYRTLLSQLQDHDIHRQLNNKQFEVNQIKSEIEAKESAIRLEEQRIQQKTKEYEVIRDHDPCEQVYAEFQAKITSLEQEKKRVEVARRRRVGLLRQIEEVKESLDLQEHAAEKQKSRRLMQTIERELLIQFPDRVFGRLRKLCKTRDQKFNAVASQIMKSHKNAFVVDSAQTCEDVIEFLRTRRFPRQMLIPADVVVFPTNQEAVIAVEAHKAEFVRSIFVSNTFKVTVQRGVDRIIDFVCGSTLLCNDMDQAFAIKDETNVNCVALNGTLFRRDGVICGPIVTDDWSDAYNETTHNMLRLKLDGLMTELQSLPQEKAGLPAGFYDATIESVKLKMREMNQGYSSLQEARKQQRIEAEASLQDYRQKIEKLKAERTDLVERLNAGQKELEGLERAKREVTKGTFKEFCERNSIADISQIERDNNDAVRELVEKRAEIEGNIAACNYELDRLKVPLDENLEIVKSKIDDLNNQASIEQATVNERESELQGYEREIDQLNAKMRELQEQVSSKEAEVLVARSEITRISERKNKLRDAEFNRRDLKSNTLSAMALIVNQAEKRGTFLPVRADACGDIELYGGPDRSQSSLSSATTTRNAETTGNNPLMDVEGGFMDIDYSRISKKADELLNDGNKFKLALSLHEGRIRKLKKEIAMLQVGASNSAEYVVRIRELKTAEHENVERFTEWSERAKSAKLQLNFLRERRQNLFMTKFQEMSKMVDIYYKALYGDRSTSASLALIGIGPEHSKQVVFMAQPPGKSVTDVDKLSGGEQSMAIIALLFAGKAADVDFLLLDEVDAALDSDNMARLANFINNQSQRGLQILAVSHCSKVFSWCCNVIEFYHHCTQPCIRGAVHVAFDISVLSGQPTKHVVPDVEAEATKKTKDDCDDVLRNVDENRNNEGVADQLEEESQRQLIEWLGLYDGELEFLSAWNRDTERYGCTHDEVMEDLYEQTRNKLRIFDSDFDP